LLLALSLILLVSFLGVSVLNYLITCETIHRDIIRNDLPLTRDNIYSELTSELKRPILVASTMASDTFLQDWVVGGENDLNRIQVYLGQIADRYGFFSSFLVSEHTGNYYHFTGLHKVVSPEDTHDVWYYDFVASGKEQALDVDTDEVTGHLTIFINTRLEALDGQFLGVTGVGLKMDAVARMITYYQEKYDRSIYLVDTNGLVQVHADHSLIEQANIADMEGLGSLAGDILVSRDEPATFRFTRGGHPILLTVRYVPMLDWLIFVEQDAAARLATARSNMVRTLGVGFIASLFIIAITLAAVNNYHRKVEDMTVSDGLTGIANRCRLEMEFDKVAGAFERYGRPCSLVLMDLDGFKQVNDRMGHIAGDGILRDVTRLLHSVVRPTDLLARWGGDEFAVLSECNGEDALMVAERIRAVVEETDLAGRDARPDDPRNNVAISCGVAVYQKGDTLDSLTMRADRSLRACKAAGGNRVGKIADTQ
jgi:diguanylate cyclase (GGDEF)-like protein